MTNRRLLITAVTLLALCLVAIFAARVTTDSKGPADMSPPQTNNAPAEPDMTLAQYTVINSYPHDRRAFTQGLVYEDGSLYEGTGLYGQSAIIRRELETGKVVKMLRLPSKYFGEGITVFGDKLIQLTWRSNTGFVYTKDTFTLLREFTYPTEGWGITHDGRQLIYSDGTATLHFLDPNTYAETGRISVMDRGRPVHGLNELEFIDGSIYANIWPTYDIVIIDPKTGRVTGRLDMTALYTPPAFRRSEDVLNGIAYLPETGHLLVTGKRWPRLYQIELVSDPSREE